jgi:hypothetical protein
MGAGRHGPKISPELFWSVNKKLDREVKFVENSRMLVRYYKNCAVNG